jgi:DNA polymerase III subunit beta
MKFTVERDRLSEAVTWAARALPSRPVIPVLGGLLVHAGDDGLTVSCFDYEVSARMRIPAEVAEPGEVLVPGRLFAEITRSLPGLPVEFADDPDGISVICGDAAFTVATLPSAEYPELPDLPLLAGIVDGGVLAAAIGQVTPAASRDDTLPVLTAVSLEFTAGAMSLAATDRYRLAVRDLDWSPAPWIAEQARADGRVAVLVPARTLADAARMMSAGVPVRVMLRDGDGDVDGDGGGGDRDAVGNVQRDGLHKGRHNRGSLGGDAMIGFECGERRLTTRLLAGEFIKYRSRFPAEFGCTADLPAQAFAEAVRRVSLVAERGTPVQLSFARGRVTIGASTQGQARAREIVPADFTGDEPVIAFSPHYLLDGVIAASAALPGNAHPNAPAPDTAVVRLQFSGPSKPAVLSQGQPGGADAGKEFRYLVVPQRVQS